MEKRRVLTSREKIKLDRLLRDAAVLQDGEPIAYLPGQSDNTVMSAAGFVGVNANHVARLRLELYPTMRMIAPRNTGSKNLETRVAALEAAVAELQSGKKRLL